MKIAILSDIHGNQYALKAVLRDIKREKIINLLVLGDFVGYYYRPDIILKRIKKYQCIMVKGNHETMLSAVLRGAIKPEAVRTKYGTGLHRSIQLLSTKELSLLQGLPEKIIIERGGMRLLLCHGAPWDPEYYIYPDSKQTVLDRCLDSPADIILVGHSHYPFIYCRNGKMLINPGSIGQSRDKGGVASWAVINTKNKSVIFKRTPYNTLPLLNDTKRYDRKLPYLRNVLTRE
jgi:putative phosphoesterase